MSVLDEVLAANATFADRFNAGDLPAPPSRKLAVLTCMDARILPPEVFGLASGDAHILRNAGGRVTDDVLRSLLVSTHVLGVASIAVVHHTQCGGAKYTQAELQEIIGQAAGRSTGDLQFFAIGDPEAALQGDVERLLSSGLLPTGVEVGGYQYDVHTGRLRVVVAPRAI